MADHKTAKAARAEHEIVDVTQDEEEADSVEDVDGDIEDDDDELEFDDDDAFDHPMQQLTQLLVTEDGTPLVDVLAGIQQTLDKQNKILFKLVSLLDARLGK